MVTLIDWIIVLCAVVIGTIAVIGMINETYQDTLPQTVGLTVISGMSVIIVLQVFLNGQVSQEAFAWMLVGISIYAVATLFKHSRFHRMSRPPNKREA